MDFGFRVEYGYGAGVFNAIYSAAVMRSYEATTCVFVSSGIAVLLKRACGSNNILIWLLKSTKAKGLLSCLQEVWVGFHFCLG